LAPPAKPYETVPIRIAQKGEDFNAFNHSYAPAGAERSASAAPLGGVGTETSAGTAPPPKVAPRSGPRQRRRAARGCSAAGSESELFANAAYILSFKDKQVDSCQQLLSTR